MHKKVILAALLSLVSCTSPDTESKVESSDARSIAGELDAYSQSIVSATGQNIFAPSRAQKTDSPTLSYVIKFHTSDAALMSKDDGDTNRDSYAFNIALNKGWNARFCTPELKAIMVEHDVFLVSGHLLDASGKMQTFTSCMP